MQKMLEIDLIFKLCNLVSKKLLALGDKVSQPGKWAELGKVKCRHTGKKSEPAILDLTICRSDLTREYECLESFW